MAVNDPKVYPVSAAFEQFLIKEFKTEMVLDMAAHEYIADDKLLAVLPTAQTMAKTLGEYEHGNPTMRECTAYREAVDPITPWEASEEAEDEEKANCMEEALLNVFRAVCEDIILMMLAI